MLSMHVPHVQEPPAGLGLGAKPAAAQLNACTGGGAGVAVDEAGLEVDFVSDFGCAVLGTPLGKGLSKANCGSSNDFRDEATF